MIKEKSLDSLEFYSTKEIAEILRVNIRTILKYIDSGKLLAIKMRKNYRIEKTQFVEFLEKMKATS